MKIPNRPIMFGSKNNLNLIEYKSKTIKTIKNMYLKLKTNQPQLISVKILKRLNKIKIKEKAIWSRKLKRRSC